MLAWLAAHDAGELAAATATFYPDVAPDVLAEALARLTCASPASTRTGSRG